MNLALTHQGAGFLLCSFTSILLVLLLTGKAYFNELLVTIIVEIAAIVMIATNNPLFWALAIGAAIMTLILHWINQQPDRITLAAGRTLGLGAVTLLAAACLLPLLNQTVLPPAQPLVGSLLLVGVIAVLGLILLGGWLPPISKSLRGSAMVPWALILAPALVVSLLPFSPSLPTATRIFFENGLLIFGIISAIYNATCSLKESSWTRYLRIFVVDLALSVAVIGSNQSMATTAILLLISSHLVLAPLFLVKIEASSTHRQLLAWLALSGLPPAPTSWARLMILIVFLGTSRWVFIFGLIAYLLVIWSVLAEVIMQVNTGFVRSTRNTTLGMVRLSISWLLIIIAFAAGFIPNLLLTRVFGS